MSTLFSALLGYNPMQHLLGPGGAAHLPPVAVLEGRSFFPHLISSPFRNGLMIVFTAAAVMSIAGATVSWLRGKPSRRRRECRARYGAVETAPAE